MKNKILIGLMLAVFLSACAKKDSESGSVTDNSALSVTDYQMLASWAKSEPRDDDFKQLSHEYEVLKKKVNHKLPTLEVRFGFPGHSCAENFDVLKKRYEADIAEYLKQNCEYGAELILEFAYLSIKNYWHSGVAMDAWALYSLYDYEGREMLKYRVKTKDKPFNERLIEAKKYFSKYSQKKLKNEIGGYFFGMASLQHGLLIERLMNSSPRLPYEEIVKLNLLYGLNAVFAISPSTTNEASALQEEHQKILNLVAEGASVQKIAEKIIEVRKFILKSVSDYKNDAWIQMLYLRLAKYIEADLLSAGFEVPSDKGGQK